VGREGIEASKEASFHVVPLLLLDSYRCHMMASVVMQINDLSVDTAYSGWMHWPVPACGHWTCQAA